MHAFSEEMALNREEHNVRGWTLTNTYTQEGSLEARQTLSTCEGRDPIAEVNCWNIKEDADDKRPLYLVMWKILQKKKKRKISQNPKMILKSKNQSGRDGC